MANRNHGFTVISDDWSREHEEWLDNKGDAMSLGLMMAEERDPVNLAQYRFASVSVYSDSLDGSREKKRLFHVDRCAEQRAEGWTWLFNATKWHYFVGNRSLCGRWINYGHKREQGNNDSPDNCAACRKKLAAGSRNHRNV